MNNELTVRCRNSGARIAAPFGATLRQVWQASGLAMEHGPVAARVNNKAQGLNYRLYNNKDVEFLSLSDPDGARAYARTLFLALAKAMEDTLPGRRLLIGARVGGGYYCESPDGRPFAPAEVDALRRRMEDIAALDMPVHRIQCPVEEAVGLFRARGMDSKAALLERQDELYTYYYRLGQTVDYFYGCLLTSTGPLRLFALEPWGGGMRLLAPSRDDPSRLDSATPPAAMLGVLGENRRWQDILGVRDAGEFNRAVDEGHAADLINVSEALQEKKLSDMADQIAARGARLVLIAGPSSSGKTTTAKRLATLMMACGMRPHTLSTDDYYVNRVDTPRDASGEYDFECIGAVDTALFNTQMAALLAGDEVELPRYDFPSGRRVYEGRRLAIGPDDVVILEGNHALNPILSSQIAEDRKYRVFVSPLTTIQLDDHNHIPTEDIRLLRRVLRDHKYRGYSARDTIRRFPSVGAGERKWIFPFAAGADAFFNSALLYELAVIRAQVTPLLEQVPERAPEYAEASRLRKLLRYFRPVPADQVPPTSLLREFAGGSSFKY